MSGFMLDGARSYGILRATTCMAYVGVGRGAALLRDRSLRSVVNTCCRVQRVRCVCVQGLCSRKYKYVVLFAACLRRVRSFRMGGAAPARAESPRAARGAVVCRREWLACACRD